ncbi:hypothetical protein J2W14_000517 [Pseudarthrobacter oxydans]|uniref:hypothetical protein n=1 Tax=Pseudarthrobacter oxydans TaxID=1671 RepID=UPI00278144CB|nr:hypothetical protein [Pseudarthrobacter oxydans]MDP9981141.1 hypothetical protein [Pseudarthrobacter oxydans]
MNTQQVPAWWTDEPVSRWWTEWDSDKLCRAGEVYAPASVRIFVQGWRGYDVALTAKATPAGFACSAVTISERDNPVDYDALRAVPITEMLRPALETLYYCIPPSVLITWKPNAKPYEIDREFIQDKKVRTLYTAAIYQLARFAGVGPREAVQDYFDVSRATSTRMVAAAREAGLISDAPPELRLASGEVLEMLAGGPATGGCPPPENREQ